MPVGVEQTAGGYEVAFENAATNQFSIWNTDSNGNFISFAVYSGTSTALETLETSFQQDLNGDGVIGVPTPVIGTGSTDLVQVGNNYFLNPVAGGTGPELKYNGSPVVAGQFDAVRAGRRGADGRRLRSCLRGSPPPINSTIWNTDSNGNFLSTHGYAGTSTALETLETSFHQDLNGDGVIGVPTTVIEASGSTSLVQVGSNYFLDPAGGGTGPELKYNGSPVVAGEFDPYVPVGVEQTAGGYEVAFEDVGHQSILDLEHRQQRQLPLLRGLPREPARRWRSLETSFHQDLNGDGVIGLPTTVIEALWFDQPGSGRQQLFLDPVAGGTGPELKYNGSAVVAGQFGRLCADRRGADGRRL